MLGLCPHYSESVVQISGLVRYHSSLMSDQSPTYAVNAHICVLYDCIYISEDFPLTIHIRVPSVDSTDVERVTSFNVYSFQY
jgi:hypothetical protein